MSKASSGSVRLMTVQEGDCVFSIAAREGIPWRRIWDHPDNQDLVRLRETPSILMPGDVLIVPEREQKQVAAQTEQRHRFRKKIQHIWLRLVVEEFGEPRAKTPYHVMVGDRRFEGKTPTTDADGLVECRLPADTAEAVVVLGEEGQEVEYEVMMGHIDPVDKPEGLHGRLANMDFYYGGIDTPYDDESKQAYAEFLSYMGPANPEVDDAGASYNRKHVIDGYGS